MTALINYTPFGEAIATTEQITQPFRYAARELDGETGLYYYRARYYDPNLARFLSEDPIGLAGGVNEYAYVGNDPINLTDPSGMCPQGFALEIIETESGEYRAVCKGGDG